MAVRALPDERLQDIENSDAMTLSTGEVLQNRYRVVSLLDQGGIAAHCLDRRYREQGPFPRRDARAVAETSPRDNTGRG